MSTSMRNIAGILVCCICHAWSTQFIPLNGYMYHEDDSGDRGDMNMQNGPSQENVNKMVMKVFMKPDMEDIHIYMPEEPEPEPDNKRSRKSSRNTEIKARMATNTEHNGGSYSKINFGYIQRSRKISGLNVGARRTAADVYTKRSPASLLHKFHPASPEGAMDSCLPSQLLKVAKEIREKYTRFSPKLFSLFEIDEESRSAAENTCPQIELRSTKECNPQAEYRSMDGSCNNLDNPLWGARLSLFVRFLPPQYEDGLNAMRGEGRGCECKLPDPRDLSRALHLLKPEEANFNISMMVMQWGQFLDHDLTLTPVTPIENGNFTCCDEGVPAETDHPEECRPLDYRGEILFKKKKKTCARFVRSLIANEGFKIGVREQLNENTAFVDGSHIYGRSIEETKELREYVGGRLKTSTSPKGETMLPTIKKGGACQATRCFYGGDERVEEQPGLTSIHTVFLRLHNRIVDGLAQSGKHDDETLFQEGRRIVGALLQLVTFREFLPLVLGEEAMNEWKLTLKKDGHHDTYDVECNPAIANVFATAAFRFGHTLIRDEMKGFKKNVSLRSHFDDAELLLHEGTSPGNLLHGLTKCPAPASDVLMATTVINHLFQSKDDPLGFDLMALNIQRGRDHGIAGYTSWRNACGLKPVKDFGGLIDIMPEDAIKKFKHLYWHVHDIDLFPAGLAEYPEEDGILGPTFTCLIGQQFSNLKHGDRFWHENPNQPKPFTEAQLKALREQNLASLFCMTTECEEFQRNALLMPNDDSNKVKPCSSHKEFDFGPWKKL